MNGGAGLSRVSHGGAELRNITIARVVGIVVSLLAMSWGAGPSSRAETSRPVCPEALVSPVECVDRLELSSIKVYVVSVQSDFRAALTADKLDSWIQSGHVDVEVGVNDGALVKRISTTIAEVPLVSSGSPQDLDLRYRIDLLKGNSLLGSLYADRAGRMEIDGKAYDVRDEGDWLRRFWELVNETTSDSRSVER